MKLLSGQVLLFHLPCFWATSKREEACFDPADAGCSAATDEAVAGSSLLSRRGSMPISAASRLAVVSNFKGLKNLSWLEDIPRVEVGFDSPRDFSESRPWIQWILANYDNLPDVVMFLHGDRTSWHHEKPYDLQFLKTTMPSPLLMLSDPTCAWTSDLPERIPGELPALNAIHMALFGKDFRTMFIERQMAMSFVCCTEHMIIRDSLRRYDKSVYTELIELMNRHPNQAWAWIWERSFQNFWLAPVKSNEEIRMALKAINLDKSNLVQVTGDDTGSNLADQAGEIIRASSACIHPL
mmetsp:Transcript_127228/g.206964  ORF Transcript_127228/g.206964 Transcript_127228/m.206964 type:complete len:296 (+) Transcript_127228:70-957(+)